VKSTFISLCLLFEEYHVRFHQMSLNVQIICIYSKNAIRKNVDFQKNIAECKLKSSTMYIMIKTYIVNI